MLLEDVLKEFLFNIEIQNFTKKARKSYKNNNLAFLNYIFQFNTVKLEDVTPQHIKAYFSYLQQKGRKASYINGILINIRSFFN
ncbi:phage integrase SAM-like domain-containing protein [Bacillus smithii]|uniref:phage integrase SAM-like domain-containing protein n=1 Tax=Bacillus smithii TaxID=1479 RepID=UPI002E22D64A|nr:phage integrase N-terminal SAM-like domain-containing protein [Bacillus smithii]MED1457844.1 phage integrase N-terminal SAM-like domain-containing protein [Bacillus smithii]